MIHRQLTCRSGCFTIITNIDRSSVFPPLRFPEFSSFLFFFPDCFCIQFSLPIIYLHQNFLAVQVGEPSLPSFLRSEASQSSNFASEACLAAASSFSFAFRAASAACLLGFWPLSEGKSMVGPQKLKVTPPPPFTSSGVLLKKAKSW